MQEEEKIRQICEALRSLSAKDIQTARIKVLAELAVLMSAVADALEAEVERRDEMNFKANNYHVKEARPVDPHTPGAKLDAGKVRAGLVLSGFSRALLAVSEVGTFGAKKYSEDGWKSVPNGEARYLDAAFRHLLAEGVDEESGLPHLAHAAWNVLAVLELRLRDG